MKDECYLFAKLFYVLDFFQFINTLMEMYFMIMYTKFMYLHYTPPLCIIYVQVIYLNCI